MFQQRREKGVQAAPKLFWDFSLFGALTAVYTKWAAGSLQKSLEIISNCCHKNLTDFSHRQKPMQGKQIYEFGSFRLDPLEHLLLHEGKLVALTPKAFETLAVLVEKNGHLVGKEELIERGWPDTIVEEGNLNNIIYILRKALGSEANEDKYIETIPKRGYRFVAEVRKVIEEESAEPESSLRPLTHLSWPFRRRPGLASLAAVGLALTLSAAIYLAWRSHPGVDGKGSAIR